MEPFVRNFIRASLLWLGVGVLLGLWMVIDARAIVYRPAHMHANLLGFVSMMIFGVAYHVLPRFTGNPLWSRRLPPLHLWVANLGLALMVAGWLARPHIPAARVVLLAGALASAAGAFLFICNIWWTVGRAAAAATRPVQLAGRA